MPESKNSFLGGKMNKDLDDRIIPNDQYLGAGNIRISKADSSNVGVAKNTKGNTNKTSRGLISAYRVIGRFVDEQNSRVFLFTTNNGSDHRISIYSSITETITDIVTGSFLNFSHNYLITGINLIEDMLCWTDYNNQPRKINVVTAIADPTFYNSEVKISVAKYAPVYSPKISAVEKDASITSDDIELEFVRIGYRYKFVDNEYSLYSPFTSSVFKMEDNEISDQEEVYSTTEVALMVNGINKVTIQIPVPSATPVDDYEISEIDILIKKAGDTAIRVIDTIDVATATIASKDFDMDGSNEQPAIEYVYSSSKPKYTLPENQITRVEDKVPVKAKAQAIASNRLIYGNIVLGYDLPTINYSVFYSPKTANLVTHKPMLANQSVKSRRLYQVGIVLTDIHGRSTPVILSKTSSVYVEAKDDLFDSSTWDGDTLKVVFGDVIPNAYNVSSNPLGWYSFKIVVKQLEQEYYNVYTPGVIAYTPTGKKTWIQLLGDNVNKVPRDITSTNMDVDAIVPSATNLWPKVLNTTDAAQVQSNGDIIDVLGIGDQVDHGVDSAFFNLYESSDSDILASLAVEAGEERFSFSPILAVFETEPFESTIDVYYETPTCGLVSQINNNINDVDLDDWSVASGSISTAGGNVAESTTAGTYIKTLYAFSNAGTFTQLEPGACVFTLNSGGTVSSEQRYTVEVDPSDGHYKIKLNKTFVYDSVDDSRTLNITATFGSTSTSKNISITEIDTAPSITGPTTGVLDSTISPGSTGGGGVDGGVIMKVYGVNGSAKTSQELTDLTFAIVSATHNGNNVAANFGIVSNYNETVAEPGTGTLYVASSIAALDDSFDITFVIKVSDSNGDCLVNLNTVIDITSGGGSSAPILAYKASYGSFSSVIEANSVPISDPRWTPITAYIVTGSNPFITLDTADKIFIDSGMTTGLDNGWYTDDANGTGQWLKSTSPAPGSWIQLGPD